MMEKREEETPAISNPDFDEKSDSGKDPTELKTEEENPVREGEKPAGREVQEPKRRRKCPAALDKFEEFETSKRNFSFSFDTKITSGGTPESTPKFGSFNLVGNLGLLNSTTPLPEEEEGCDQISLGFTEHNKEEEEETEEEQKKCEIENSISIVVRTAD